MRKKKSGFTLIELMVVIAIIMLVAGMTVPMMTQLFDKQKLPRSAKVLSTFLRNAQVTAVNYLMSTQIELVPGTDDQIRTWGFSAYCKYPTTADSAMDWDKPNNGYTLISEARRLNKSGGKIRFLPLNPYSLEPQNAEDFASLSAIRWEFSELRYKYFDLEEYDRGTGNTGETGSGSSYTTFKEVAVALRGLTFDDGTLRGGTHKIGIETPVGIQVLLGTVKKLPTGVGIDVVNYVVYADATGDGMPDGNPLALIVNRQSGVPNPIEPLIIKNRGGAVKNEDLYSDFDKRKPSLIGGSLMFSKDGLLKRNASLRYLSRNPTKLNALPYFSSGKNESIDTQVYGFILYDKSSPQKRVMVEITGMGQIRFPYGVFARKNMKWGKGFFNDEPNGEP